MGTHVDVSHTAATPLGLTITVEAVLTKREGRRLEFAVVAHDGGATRSAGAPTGAP